MADNSQSNDQKLCPGKEMFLDANDLEPGVYRKLVARRARLIVESTVPKLTDEGDRRELEQAIQERVNKEADFLPARFLVDGSVRAKAVCRISTSTSLGTGFLIAPGILMTNNHVISSMREAQSSTAQFGFEEGETMQRIAINPDRIFITDRELDFTIVGCNDETLEGITPIPLLRDPSTVTRRERVSIIQHPRGRKKEVALHDNHVERIMDKVVRYRTDTEPGSSGSPVFNFQWDLVALHHAGFEEPGGTAMNEGIRISAIVAHLLARSNTEGSNQENLYQVLSTVTDTSPYLGFFDVAGIFDDSQEVEVPDFQGTKEFADVGVWNIEHFNNSISDERVKRVSDVIAQLSLDVIGLTEVQNGAMLRLVDELGQRGSAVDFELLNVPGSQDIAVLFDRDTTTVEKKDFSTKHKRLLGKKTSGGKSIFPRFPLLVKCIVEDDEGGSVEFLMIVVHLKAFGDATSRERRRQASNILATIIADLRDKEKLPVVLGGDFNERLDTDVLNALKESPDLFSLTADDAISGAISFVGRRHRSLIDHLIVSNDMVMGEIAGDDAAIVRLDQSVADFSDAVSDHVPLVFRMVIRENVIQVDPDTQADSAVSVPIPAGVESVKLSFENGHVEFANKADRKTARGEAIRKS